MHPVIRILFAFTTLLLLKTIQSFGQEGYDLKLTKPQKYENRKLGYENTYTKKFGVKRKFLQNTVTHYNYYYNANLKLDEVVANAKASFVDDFTKLLPFYNYDLNTTAGFTSELDSVIYKASSGIILHDLRNDWIDNLYYLIGKAYYLKKETDSAAVTFQFLNYAFAPREKDGYARVIASNATEGGNAFTIATKEKQSLTKRMFAQPPSRNDALIWMARTAIEQEDFAKAAGLLQAFRNDPSLPQRLHASLAEVNAYYFYKQNLADSAAYYLEKALPVAQGNAERARWQFLLGQLYEQAEQPETAILWYNTAIKTTINPILDIYARLNAIRLNKEGGDNFIQENIEALYKMARKDNYSPYRDIIYYTAGIMDLERQNRNGSVNSFLRSLHFNTSNLPLRNKAFLELGNQYFLEGAYKEAKAAYDSLDLAALGEVFPANIQSRKDALGILVENTAIIERQDSLQVLAAMPETDRDALLLQTLKTYNKNKAKQNSNQQGNHVRSDHAAEDLFAGNTKGEWYFYNKEISARGTADFTAKWGTRANMDNWRRMSATNRSNVQESGTPQQEDQEMTDADNWTYEGLLAPIPLTPEKMQVSNDSIIVARFHVAEAYQVHLEDYAHAAFEYEALLEKFPDTENKDNIYFNLYYCYWKLGLNDKANRYKQALNTDFPGSPFTLKLALPGQVKDSPENLKKEATALYEQIYLHYIEGQFTKAEAMKRAADSIHGNSYWTPQLLYIEAVYHIKERQDPQALIALDNIINIFNESPMLAKAENLKAVLLRRDEIETYLTNLEITRASDTPVTKMDHSITQEDDLATAALKDSLETAGRLMQEKQDSIEKQLQSIEIARLARAKDSLEKQAHAIQKEQAVKDSIDKHLAVQEAQRFKRQQDSIAQQALALERLQATKDSAEKQRATLELAKLAHTKDSLQKEELARQKQLAVKDSIEKQQAALALAKLAYTKDSLQKEELARQKQLAVKDSIEKQQALLLQKENAKQDSILKATAAMEEQRKAAYRDSLQRAEDLKKEAAFFTLHNFAFEPGISYYVLLIFNKVDPVYVSESRNAFTRYNREEYNKDNISLEPLSLTDTTKLLVFKSFATLETAETYRAAVNRKAALEIVPWLPVGKYEFHLITEKNLKELMRTKNLKNYTEFWKEAMKVQSK